MAEPSKFFANLLAAQKKTPRWPPDDHTKKHWDLIKSYQLRYDNDRQRLIQSNPNIAIVGPRTEVYVPIGWPRELCRFSAALLFSETPKVTSDQFTDLVDDIERINDFGAFAILGGIKTAKDGNIGIRVLYDEEISKLPLLTLVEENQIIWHRKHGTFYVGGIVVLERQSHEKGEEKIVYRLLESHSTGLVERKLFKGDNGELGDAVSLKKLPEFAELDDEWETGLDSPTLIPWENIPGAESDMFGLGPVFDLINEAESLMLDRGRKATPRVFVDRSLADETGRLEIDGFILSGGSRLRAPLGTDPGKLINIVQPDFLAEEHIKWMDHITQLMVTVAGYAPVTWGIQGNTATIQRAVSGYAMKLSQLRTLLNRSGKEHMALQAIGWAFGTAIALEKKIETVAECLPGIELGDGLPADPLDGAQEVLWLRQAQAASTETLVETIHPTWTPDQVSNEVNSILDAGMFPPGGAQSQGVGPLGQPVRDLLRRLTGDSAAGGGVDPGAAPVVG